MSLRYSLIAILFLMMPTISMAQSSWTEAHEMHLNGTLDVPSISGEVLSNLGAGSFGGFTIHPDRASFEAATSNRSDEDFEANLVTPGGVVTCGLVINSLTNDACFEPGNIIPNVDFSFTGTGTGMVVLGAGFLGAPSDIIGPVTFDDVLTISNLPSMVGGEALGVAFDAFALTGTTGVTVTVTDMNGGTLSTLLPGVGATAVFYGVTSTTPIVSFVVDAGPGGGELIDDFSYALSLLPVELVTFDARSEDQQIQLSWETSSESNNAGFGIEISTDAEEFVERGWVDGHGSSTETHSYSYQLESLVRGKQFVRLRQVDFDGVIEYSPVLEVTTEIPGGIDLQSAYPNPFNPSTSIQFSVAEEMHVQLALYNSTGQLVATPFSELVPEADIQNVEIDGAGLPSGTYFVRLESQIGSVTQAITLLK